MEKKRTDALEMAEKKNAQKKEGNETPYAVIQGSMG